MRLWPQLRRQCHNERNSDDMGISGVCRQCKLVPVYRQKMLQAAAQLVRKVPMSEGTLFTSPRHHAIIGSRSNSVKENVVRIDIGRAKPSCASTAAAFSVLRLMRQPADRLIG